LSLESLSVPGASKKSSGWYPRQEGGNRDVGRKGEGKGLINLKIKALGRIN